MNTKRRTVLKALIGTAIAAVTSQVALTYASGGKVDLPWATVLDATPIHDWLVPESPVLSMPHGGGLAWLEFQVASRYVPNLGSLVIVNLQEQFGCTFSGTVTKISPVEDKFQVTVVEQAMHRDDI